MTGERDRLAALLHEVGLLDDTCVHRPPFYACHRYARDLIAAGVRLPPSGEDGGQDERLREALVPIAARMVRLEGGCESGHKPGQWHMHEARYFATGQAIAAAIAAPTPSDARERPVSLDAEALTAIRYRLAQLEREAPNGDVAVGLATADQVLVDAIRAATTPEPTPCARYWGSDGTLCSTHNGRFPAPDVMKCDLSEPGR